MKKIFIILYTKGIHGPILGWFGEFESEEQARDIFPFPQASTHIIQVIEVPGKDFNNFLDGAVDLQSHDEPEEVPYYAWSSHSGSQEELDDILYNDERSNTNSWWSNNVKSVLP